MPTEDELVRQRLGARPGDGVPPGIRRPNDATNRTVPGSTPRRQGEYGVGLFGWEAGGPLHPGHTSDQHLYGPTKDGENINVGHIWTEGMFYKDQERDAPILFERQYWRQPGHFPLRSYVHLRFDPQAKHTWPGGQGRGRWKFECEVPEMITVPPTRNGDDDDDEPPPTQETPPPTIPQPTPNRPGVPTGPGTRGPDGDDDGDDSGGGGANQPGSGGPPAPTSPGAAPAAPGSTSGGTVQPGQPGFIGPINPHTPQGDIWAGVLMKEDTHDWNPDKHDGYGGWDPKPGPFPFPLGNPFGGGHVNPGRSGGGGVPAPADGEGGGVPRGNDPGRDPAVGPAPNGRMPDGGGGGSPAPPPPPSAGGPAYGSNSRNEAWERYYESLYGSPTMVKVGNTMLPSWIVQHGKIYWYHPNVGYKRSRPRSAGSTVNVDAQD